MTFSHDALIFAPADVDLARSPLAGQVDAETYVLGAFNPGMTRLPNGNLLLMVRVAEALRTPIRDQFDPCDPLGRRHSYTHSIPWPIEYRRHRATRASS